MHLCFAPRLYVETFLLLSKEDRSFDQMYSFVVFENQSIAKQFGITRVKYKNLGVKIHADYALKKSH